MNSRSGLVKLSKVVLVVGGAIGIGATLVSAVVPYFILKRVLYETVDRHNQSRKFYLQDNTPPYGWV